MKLRALFFATLLLTSVFLLAPPAGAAVNGDPFVSGASTVEPGNPCNLSGRAGGVAVDPVAKRVYYTSKGAASIANMSALSPFGCTLVATSVPGIGGWTDVAFDAWHAQARFWAANGTKVYGLSGAGVLVKGPLDAGGTVAAVTMDALTQNLVVLLQGASSAKRYSTTTLLNTATVTFTSPATTLTGWEGGYLTGDANYYVRLANPTGAHAGVSFRPHTNHQDEFYQPYQNVQGFLQIALDTGGYAPRNALWTVQESASFQCVANCSGGPAPVYECDLWEGTTCLHYTCVANCTPTGPPPVYVVSHAPSLRAFEVFRPCPGTNPVWQPCGGVDPCAGVTPPDPAFLEPQQGAYVRGQHRPGYPGMGVVGYGGTVPVRVTDATGLAGKTINVTGLPTYLETVGAQAVGSLDARTQARGSYTVVARITDAAGCYTRVDSINVWLENPVARTKAQNLRVQGNIPLHLVAGTLPVEPADRLEGAARFDLAGPISAQTLGTEAQILTADARHGPHDDSIMADASTVARRSRVSIDLGTLCYDLTAQPGCWTLPDLWADAGANDLSSYAGVQVVPRYGAIYSYGGVAGMGEWVQASSSSLGTHMTGGADVWHKHAAAYIAAIGLNQPLLNEGAYQGLPIADEYQVGPFHAWIGRVDARSGSLFAEVTSTVLRVEVNEGPYHGEIVFGESYAGVSLGAASLLKGPPRFMDPQDDFGAGGDAPVTPMASGAPVLGPGVYAGQLEDQDRNDSFRVSALPGQKLKVVLQPSHRMTVLAAPAPTLPATDAAPRYIRLTLTDPSNRTRDTSFLAVDAHPAEVELNVDEIGLWGVRIDRTDARNETAPYTVAVALSPIMVLDGEGPTGVDAGACGAGMPITGAIEGGMDQFDAVDTFTVTVPARGNLTATLVMPDLDGQDLDLRLLSPTCALLQESATHGPGAKGVAESIVALEMAAGTYSVQVVRHNGIGSYALETVVAG